MFASTVNEGHLQLLMSRNTLRFLFSPHSHLPEYSKCTHMFTFDYLYAFIRFAQIYYIMK